MEVYKITCKINNKVYIGSTQYTKETRWKNGHLRIANRKKNINNNLLYKDIKKYGKENFKLETIEYVEGDKKYLLSREDFWIKKYWNELGKDMMYNKWDLAYGSRNWSVPHNPEFQKKAAKVRQERYGTSNAKMITSEAMKKAKETKIRKYGNAGPHLSIEAQKSQINKISNRILDNSDNTIIIGYKNVVNKLNKEGYNVTLWQVKKIIYKKMSKSMVIKTFKNYNIINRFKNLGRNI